LFGMDHSWLTAFGLFAVSAMLLFYWLEDRSPWFVFAFGLSCWLGAIYGFLQGAWPFGIVETIWGVIALKKWQRLRLKKVQAAPTGLSNE